MVPTTSSVLVLVLSSVAALAQQPNPPETQSGTSSTDQPAASETPIPPVRLVTNIVHDQKPIWTFPGKVVQGQHWKPVLAVALGTAALVALDPYTEPYFHDRSGFSSYKTGPLRGRNTTLAITMTPLAFYLAGLAEHRPHARNTGLLAAEAIADTQIVSFVIKQAVGRLKPSDIPAHGDLRDTWFQYRSPFLNAGSFPSGHTASAFAVASVISERYREHRWIPWVAYGAATFLSLTRLPDQAHFPSDIFMGAALGYGISHFVVLTR
jgi:membrane-associated phospholipid phosphatase